VIDNSMQKQRYTTLDEFWPYYISQHRKPLTRTLHFIGNTNLFFWLLLALVRRSPRLLMFAVVSSYALAWIGHFGVEKNKPATFDYPILSAFADMRMYWHMLNGTADGEIAKYLNDVPISYENGIL
jgi:hypothetical protein